MPCTAVPLLNARLTPAKVGVESVAATAIPLVPDAGELVMYGLLPALPDADTTMMPSLAAFDAATASGSVALPKSEPSDMLMTSMWCVTAHSMPSITTLLEPAQPKTRIAYRSALGATPGPTFHECELMVVAL